MIRCFFDFLGHAIAKWPIAFGAISLALSLLLSCGITWLQLKDHIRDGYTPENAPSWAETAEMRRFWNSTGDPMRTFVLIRSKLPDRNLLRLDLLSRSVRLHQFILHEFVPPLANASAPCTYSDLCSPYCEFNFPLELFVDALNESVAEHRTQLRNSSEKDGQNNANKNNLSFPVASVHSFRVPLEWFLFGVSLKGPAEREKPAQKVEQQMTNMNSVYMIQLTFSADRSTPAKSRQLSQWEMSLYDFLRFDYNDTLLDVQVIGMDILDNEMTRDNHETVPFFSTGLLLVVAFVAVNVFGTVSFRRVQLSALGPLLLVLATVCCPLLAIGSTFGAMALLGFRINSFLLVLPYLVLGIGVDDGFLLMHRWFQLAESVKSAPRRLRLVLADIGPSVTVTSLTNVISFGIGAFTPTPEIRLFCFGTALALTFDYVLQITLFCPIMQFSAYFEQSSADNDHELKGQRNKEIKIIEKKDESKQTERGKTAKRKEEEKRGEKVKEEKEQKGGGKESGEEEEKRRRGKGSGEGEEKRGRRKGSGEGEEKRGGKEEKEQKGGGRGSEEGKGKENKESDCLSLREPSGGKRKWSPLEQKNLDGKEGEIGTTAADLLDGFLDVYCTLLRNRCFAAFLLFSTLCYWYGSLRGSLSIQSKLDTRKILPKGSKLQETFILLEQFVWANHFTVTVKIDGLLNVSSTEEMRLFYELVQHFERIPRSKGPSSSLVWLRDFERFCRYEDDNLMKMERFIKELELGELAELNEETEEEKGAVNRTNEVTLCRLDQFLDMPFYSHWAPFIRQHVDSITGCPSVHCFILVFAYQNVSGWDVRIELMQRWRAIAKAHSRRMPWLNFSVWEYNAQFVDQMLSLPSVTVHSFLLTMCCMLFVCALFVPSLFSVLFAGLSISSISVGVFGFLSWLHFDLDPVTMAATLMSIGLSVDFTAHITYHFRQSHRIESNNDHLTGNENVRFVPLLSKEDKLKHTLAAVGWPMIQSGVSTALCISPLLFTHKYAPAVFVFAVFLVSAWGLLHGLLLLPCALSFLPLRGFSSRPFHCVLNFLTWRRKLRIWEGKAATNGREGEEKLGQLGGGSELRGTKNHDHGRKAEEINGEMEKGAAKVVGHHRPAAEVAALPPVSQHSRRMHFGRIGGRGRRTFTDRHSLSLTQNPLEQFNSLFPQLPFPPPLLPMSHPFFVSSPLSPSMNPFAFPFSPLCSPFLLLLLLFPEGLRLISIDNDIIGEPDIECLDQEIRVWVRTRKFFQGRIYTKGKADDPECAKDDFSTRRTKKVHFDLRLGRCGMKSLRSFDPRGMYYGVTLVISFHPLFITKVDQAFHVKCFFEEAQRGLTAELGVSMLPTTEVEARHGIPGCSYSIHRSSIDDLDAGKPAGSAIQFARVGDKVLHQWHCDDQMFGILINNCFVTDGVRQKHRVIDEKGCPVDPIAITGIRYASDLQRAYAESQVFKFADRPGVWFFCQIQMCMKKDGMCDGITPPGCATTSAPTKGVRGRIEIEKRKGGEDERKGEKEDEETTEGTEGNNSSSEQQEKGESRKAEEEEKEVNEEQQKFSTSRKSTERAGEEAEGTADERTEEGQTEGEELANGTTKRPDSQTVSQIAAPSKQRLRENAFGSVSAYGGYGVPSPIGTGEAEEQAQADGVTAFGPGFLSNQLGEGPLRVGRDPPGKTESPDESNPTEPSVGGLKGQPQMAMSAEFETEDDLISKTIVDNMPTPGRTFTDSAPMAENEKMKDTERETAKTTESGQKKDYSDYETDVTVPPNLTDLLANLQPADITARNLQRMFRDSVTDRRTLLHGFDLLIRKMKKEEGEKEKTKGKRKMGRRDEENGGEATEAEQSEGQRKWERLAEKQRTARDSPIGEIPSISRIGQENHMGKWHAFRHSDGPNDSPMIAGQLLIYDLDERPPATEEKLRNPSAECAITRNGMAMALIGGAALAAILLLMAFFVLSVLPKQRTKGKEENNIYDEEERKKRIATGRDQIGGKSSGREDGRWWGRGDGRRREGEAEEGGRRRRQSGTKPTEETAPEGRRSGK
ncbi:hypothetical protein niasHS_002444 [Heterodera schachtii]|uniref:Uncharacterized protein n=1 Tax=Heterodera schachtii TaxID=97005 RepID=A0ABD2KK84_HETSC